MYIRSSCSSVVTINVRHVLRSPVPGASGKFTNSEQLPSPQSWHEYTETTDLLSEYPCSRRHQFRELSPFFHQLNLVSSEALTPPNKLCFHNLELQKTYCAVSRSCKFLDDCKEHVHHKVLCRRGN